MSTTTYVFVDRGASNEYPQHMFSWRNKKDFSIFQKKKVPYLLLCGPPLLYSKLDNVPRDITLIKN